MRTQTLPYLLAVVATVGQCQLLAATKKRTPEPPPLVRLVAPPPPIIVQEAPATEIILSANRKSVLIFGQLNKGSAVRFKRAIEAAPSVRTVVLESRGGSIGEALEMAAVVRGNRLDTLVERSCISACTLILLAGRDRAATQVARIGFHRPTFTSAQKVDLPTLMSIARSYYDDAGISPTFTDKTFGTPNTSVWFPTVSEMIAAHVLTRVSLGGETATAFSIVKSKDELARAIKRVSFWPSLETKYPDIAKEFLDASWNAKLAGSNDNDVATAGRAVMSKHLPEILARAPDDVLVDFLDIVGDELEAARAISFEACDRASSGKLNPTATFSKELIDRELAIMLRALEAKSVAQKPDEKAALLILKPMYLDLPADQLAAIANEPGYESLSAKCNGTLSLYRQLRTANFHSKAIVARYFFGTPD